MDLKTARDNFAYAFDNGKERKHRNKMKENLRFYMGDHWSSADKQKLANEDRIPIVLNHILRQVNAATGLQIQNRTDFHVYPIDEFGDDEIAGVLNKVIKNVQDVNKFEYTEKDVFFDGIVLDNGWYLANVNFDRDFLDGEIDIKRCKSEKVFVDPESEDYLHADAEYLGYWEWLTEKEIRRKYPNAKELQFPEKEGEQQPNITENVDNDGAVIEHRDYPAPEGNTGDQVYLFYDRTQNKKKYRVVHMWHIEYEPIFFIADMESGEIEQLPDNMKKTHADRMLKIYQMRGLNVKLIERQRPTTKYVCFCYDQMLVDDNPYGDYNGDDGNFRPYCIPGTYPLVPFYPWFRDGEKMAFIDPLKDPNMEINKRRMQGIHMLSSSGFVYNEGAVRNEDELRQYGSKPDIHIVLSPDAQIGKNFQRYEPTAIGEIVPFEEMANRDIKELGINTDLLGIAREQGGDSGILVEIRQKANIVGLEGFFDNFKRTKSQLLKQVIHLIQHIWTTEKTIRLVGVNEELVINQQDAVIDDQSGELLVDPETGQAIMQIFNNVTIGRYDVKLAESDTAPTIKHKYFAQAIELGKLIAQSGAPMPVMSMVKLSDFPNKDEMVQEVAEATQARQRMEELKFGAQAGLFKQEGEK